MALAISQSLPGQGSKGAPPPSQKSLMTCFQCGQSGHAVRNCHAPSLLPLALTVTRRATGRGFVPHANSTANQNQGYFGTWQSESKLKSGRGVCVGVGAGAVLPSGADAERPARGVGGASASVRRRGPGASAGRAGVCRREDARINCDIFTSTRGS